MIWQNMTIAERLLDRKQGLSSNRTVAIPSQDFHELLQNVSAADGFFPFLAGWFLELTREQIRGYERLIEVLDPIFDASTLEILQECLPKKQQQYITAYGNRVIAFGALHNADTSTVWFGPEAWRSEGEAWSYAYQFKSMGLLSAPIVSEQTSSTQVEQ